MGVYKPAETGVPRGPAGELRGEDCVRLVEAASCDQPLESVSSALYPIPAAPLVAAEAEGESIDPDLLLHDFRRLVPDYDAVLVEGAGGLLVPIAKGFTYADLALLLGLPVLVVVGSKLGCINHALLTLSELERRGVPVVGYVINELEAAPDAAHAVASNRETLRRHAKHPDLGLISHLAAAERDDPAATARRVASALDLSALERAIGLPDRG
jgi:dethiobiotin synthetase